MIAHPERDIHFSSSSPATDVITLDEGVGRVKLSCPPIDTKKTLAGVSSPAEDAAKDQRLGIALRAPDAAPHNKVG